MPKREKSIRVVIGKVGCDIHERGALTLARALRDAGMEVVYTGRYQTPEAVVSVAVQEGADVLALSDHTGSMRLIASDVRKALAKRGVPDIKVVAGGLIPANDLPTLERMGVTGNFGPGTPLETIVEHVRSVARSHNRAAATGVAD
ncbi:MAG: cobalamin-dependent protein [Chloroflexota bacterium]